MVETPRFSITIPAYNAEATLAETVASVQAQTFSDFEIVICNDGSTDGTLALAESLAVANPCIRVVTQENRGSGGAYNTAVRNARSDLIVMLSADDLLSPDHLELFDASVRDHPEASVFTCDGWYQYPDGRRERVAANANWANPTECALEELLEACFYGVGAAFRREVFDAVGGFREDLYAEDYLFWLLGLAQGFRHHHIDEPLSVHRRTAEQKSADAVQMRETDVRVIDELMTSGLLTPEQLQAADRSGARLRRNIRIRKTLNGLVGPAATERLVRGLRGKG